jgi:hypothetical protein
MEQFFTSLSKRQTMMLLTSLAFGGSDAIGAYDHLPEEEEELLKHRAQALVQIPREKRVPLLIQEIKRLVMQRRRHLASVDSKRLASVLKTERPAMIEVVLRALPVELADATRAELGGPKPLRLARDVRPEVLSIIRWKLEDAMKQGGPQIGGFRFTDLLTLQQRELLAVADRMGARVLSTAVAGLAEGARTVFMGQLPPDQRTLMARAAEAGTSRRLSEKDAQIVLEMHGALENPSVGLRSAGVQRIVRAAVAQGPEFAQRLVDRHQGEHGKLFQRWFRDEKSRAVKGDGGRLDIVEQLERLAQRGIVDRPMRLPPPRPMVAPQPPPPPVLAPVVAEPEPPPLPSRPEPKKGDSKPALAQVDTLPVLPPRPERKPAAPPRPQTPPPRPQASAPQRALTPPPRPAADPQRALPTPPRPSAAPQRALTPPPRPQAAPQRALTPPRPIERSVTAGRVLTAPPIRRNSGPVPAASGEPARPRRDPIAEREARRAGAVSSSASSSSVRGTDPRQRVLRDGKPLAAGPLQQIPKRKAPVERPTSSRSPILKVGQGKPPGRGPGSGSR